MRLFIFTYVLLMGFCNPSFAAMSPADKAEIGVQNLNFMPNGGFERGRGGITIGNESEIVRFTNGSTDGLTVISVPGTPLTHMLQNGDVVQFSCSSYPTGITANTNYYVTVLGSTDISVSATPNGAAISSSVTTNCVMYPFLPRRAGANNTGNTSASTVNLSIANSATNPISQNYSLVATSIASTYSNQGQEFMIPFTIPSGEQGRLETITFDYRIESGVFQAGALNASGITHSDFEVFVYDTTNNVVIRPDQFYLTCNTLNQNCSSAAINFTASTSSTNYKLIFMTAATNTNAFTFKLDNIVIGRQNLISVSALKDWQTYPITVGGASGTNPTGGTAPQKGTGAIEIAKYRQVGDTVELSYLLYQPAAGTNGAGPYTYPLPPGMVIDQTKDTIATQVAGATALSGGGTILGNGIIASSFSGNTNYHEPLTVTAFSSTTLTLTVHNTSGQSAPWSGSLSPNYAGSPLYVAFTAKVKVLGLTANTGAARADQTNYGWRPYPPTCSGFTCTLATANDCQEKRDGQDNLIRCKFTVSAVAATEARISVPYTSADVNTISSLQLAGTAIKSTGVASAFYVLREPSLPYLTFGFQNSSTGALNKQNGSAEWANGDVVSIEARYPVTGFQENGKAPVLIGGVASTSNYSERVERATVSTSCTASPCTIASGTPGITSITRSGTGAYSVNFANATFSQTPACVISSSTTGANQSILNVVPTTTAVTFSGFNSATGNAVDLPFTLICMGAR